MAQKYVSKRVNNEFLEKLYTIGAETDVNDIRMRSVLEALSIIWSQFPVADRNWEDECRANGWEMPRQPLPRTGAIWTDAELKYARKMVKSNSPDEVARMLGRSVGAVEKAISEPEKTNACHRAIAKAIAIGVRPVKNQPLRKLGV